MDSSNPKNQAGAILFISLIILLVMTIIGIAAISSVTLEGKMANNARNQKIAFQSAESALRAGETWLQRYTAMPEPKGKDCPRDCGHIWTRDGFYEYENSYTNNDSWPDVLPGPGIRDDAAKLPEAGAVPRYAIEYVDFFRDPMALGQQQDMSANVTKLHYRIIARGIGGDIRARTHLMSAYARRF